MSKQGVAITLTGDPMPAPWSTAYACHALYPDAGTRCLRLACEDGLITQQEYDDALHWIEDFCD